MDWFECYDCGASFSVVLDASCDEEISFCPCCGTGIEKEYDDSGSIDEDEEDY